jgi:RNA polymerase sigma factor (sigma-70 family)
MDEQLIQRATRGDAEAFDALARDRIDRLYAIAVRILRDHHDAEDAVQQALWTAWADMPGLREPARFDAWLYRLLVRLCYKAGRSRRRRASVVRLAPDLDLLPDAAGGDAVADRDELERAFATLSTEHRAVIVLHHYLGLGLDEVAAVLEIPHGTARSRAHYAMGHLRAAIVAADQVPSPAAETAR